MKYLKKGNSFQKCKRFGVVDVGVYSLFGFETIPSTWYIFFNDSAVFFFFNALLKFVRSNAAV